MWLWILLLFLLPSGAYVSAGAEVQPPADEIRQARTVLDAAAQAYRAVPALKDTLTYTISGPGAEPGSKRVSIFLGPGKDVSVGDALFQATAVGQMFYLTKSGATNRYLARPYAGNFTATLESLSGSLFVPAEVAMRLGGDRESCINALRFRQLSPLRIAGCRRATDARGRKVDALSFVADNGRLEATFDSETHFFSAIHLTFQPAGAPKDVTIEIQGEFAPQALDAAAGTIVFNPGDRRPVADLTDLDSEILPTGKAAPNFVLATPAGQSFELAGLKGRVVVVDFWATWCAPCWACLGEAQRLADWAATNSLPVSVLAINTLEKFATEQERNTRVAELFKARGLTLPVLLDTNGAVLRSFGSPGLPSSVVISPAGTIVKFHQGLEPQLSDRLKTEVNQALKSAE